MNSELPTVDREVPTLTAGETAAVVRDVLAPLVARGVIVRRPRAVGLLDRMDVDERAVACLRGLRDDYGEGPVRLRIPGRELAIVLSAADVHRVLEGTPEPFSPANLEKRFALRHFEPHVSLISEGDERTERRRFNEQVLETPRAVHSLAPAFVAKIREECDELLTEATRRDGRLTWDDYADAWHRIVRRIVVGDAGRDDHALTDLLEDLRRRANLAFLRTRDRTTRRRFYRQLHGHLRRAEQGSLAGAIAGTPSTEDSAPDHQVAQWLFAFDAAGWASYRALAVLAVHDHHRASIRETVQDLDLSGPHHLEDLRAAMLESLRLWPTTPAILRDTTQDTTWATGQLPAGAGVLVFAPLFHRDETRIPEAHRFAPDLWSGDRGRDDWPLVPFSGGPGECPAKDLVLFVTSTLLACLLDRTDVELRETDRIGQPGELAATLSPFHLTFDLTSDPRPTA